MKYLLYVTKPEWFHGESWGDEYKKENPQYVRALVLLELCGNLSCVIHLIAEAEFEESCSVNHVAGIISKHWKTP